MVVVERTSTTGPERLWASLSDVESWPRVLPTFRSVRRLDGDGPIGVGARFEVKQPGLATSVYEITEWEEGRAFTWVASAPGVRTTASHRLQAGPGGGTALLLTVAWSGPMAWLVRLAFGAKAKRMVDVEADTFVRRAEDAERRG